jgi:hypothetical protein
MARVRRATQGYWFEPIAVIGSRELTLSLGVQAGQLCDLLRNWTTRLSAFPVA